MLRKQKRGQPGNPGQFARDTSGRNAPSPRNIPSQQPQGGNDSQEGALGSQDAAVYALFSARTSKRMREAARAHERSGKPFSASEEQRDNMVRAYLKRGTNAPLSVQWAALAQGSDRIGRIRAELEAKGELPPR